MERCFAAPVYPLKGDEGGAGGKLEVSRYKHVDVDWYCKSRGVYRGFPPVSVLSSEYIKTDGREK